MFGGESGAGFAWLPRGKRRTAELVVLALNLRRYDDLPPLLTDNFIYFDTVGARIDGCAQFIEAARAMHQRAPDQIIEMDDVSVVDNDLLVRGRIRSAIPAFHSESLWRASFDGRRMSGLQAFRKDNAVSLPAILRQRSMIRIEAGRS